VQPPITRVPAADLDVTVELIDALLREQQPDLSTLPVVKLAEGWDNVMFRVGEAWLVRAPRRAAAAELVLSEQRWLPQLAPQLCLPIPTPARVGVPGCGYPWHWSVVPWLEGMCLDEAEPCDPGQAVVLARFLRQLHRPAPADAPLNPARGVPLVERESTTSERIERLRMRTSLIDRELVRAWEAGLAAPPSAASVWLHGDLHALNVLAWEGRLSAVLDWGDLTSGDPASDLACVWLLFDAAEARRALIEAYAPDEALLARARGWAVLLGTVLLETGLANSPRHAALGAATLRRVSALL
jgi:aminoglycoside phosphotransferase (APT) family kinase protein